MVSKLQIIFPDLDGQTSRERAIQIPETKKSSIQINPTLGFQ